MGKPFKYLLTNDVSDIRFVGTLSEIKKNFNIEPNTLSSMVRYGFSFNGFKVERYIDPDKKEEKTPAKIKSIDVIEDEARKLGMSYGQYVGLMEGKFKYDWINSKA